MKYTISQNDLTNYFTELGSRGITDGSQERYKTNIDQFMGWLRQNSLTEFDPEDIQKYMQYLEDKGDKISTINVKLSSLNGLFKYLGYHECRKSFFQDNAADKDENEILTTQDYQALLDEAIKTNKRRTGLIIEVLAETGIRVSELSYITVEALQKGEVQIGSGNKKRTIALNPVLVRHLKIFAESAGITSGPIFITRSGKLLSRTQVWMDMQRLCADADVNPDKVSPQSLRRFFARNYYEDTHDVLALANILGLTGLGSVAAYLN